MQPRRHWIKPDQDNRLSNRESSELETEKFIRARGEEKKQKREHDIPKNTNKPSTTTNNNNEQQHKQHIKNGRYTTRSSITEEEKALVTEPLLQSNIHYDKISEARNWIFYRFEIQFNNRKKKSVDMILLFLFILFSTSLLTPPYFNVVLSFIKNYKLRGSISESLKI